MVKLRVPFMVKLRVPFMVNLRVPFMVNLTVQGTPEAVLPDHLNTTPAPTTTP